MNSLSVKQSKKKDLRRRERFPFLLFLSCLIHATLVILLAFLFAKHALSHKSTHPETPPPPPPEVTLELPPPPPKERPFVEATKTSEKSAKKSPFESDEDMKAASEKAPDGSLPLPSQQGVAQAAMELQTQRYTPGEHPASSSGNPSTPRPPSPQEPPQQSQSQQKAIPTPPITPTPAPSSTPTSTPDSKATPQATPATSPPPNSLKLIEPPQMQPASAKPSTQTPAQQEQRPASPPSSSPGAPGPKKGYQPETRQTVIRGNISNRGRSSVAADATPIGRYKKALSVAIGSRWYRYIDERMGLISIGTVSVNFKVTSSGKVADLRVVSSNGNQSLTDCSLRSIMDAKLPPIPPEVAKTLQNGCFEIDFSFNIY